MLTVKCHIGLSAVKSLRDDILFPVDFNLREKSNMRILQSPAGTILFSEERRVKNEGCATFLIPHSSLYKCRPCGTLVQSVTFLVRRLKSTVNKMSSLRDYVVDNLMRHFMINLTLLQNGKEVNKIEPLK